MSQFHYCLADREFLCRNRSFPIGVGMGVRRSIFTIPIFHHSSTISFSASPEASISFNRQLTKASDSIGPTSGWTINLREILPHHPLPRQPVVGRPSFEVFRQHFINNLREIDIQEDDSLCSQFIIAVDIL